MQQEPQQKSKNGPADTGKKSKKKKKQVRAEAAKFTIMPENELLAQELDSARKQIENLQKQLEDQELKSKTDVQLLVKEVEYLRSSQTELKQELSTLMKEKLEKEKVKSEGSFVKAYMEPEMAVVESREWVSSRGYDGISTSPPYWDTDDDDEDCGLRPSQLYVKYTWKIDKFSQINQREVRSDVFEVGGYKWYILMYPQGCDVSNHLSVFLCVANHDKLLPGWNHYTQFTVAVVNKDPKRSKYSDTLHRFWKKEHDWGWKKFMMLSKVMDGFVTADTLIIKAQVQVIREKANRPFRCLDCQYRRELMHVYLKIVELICRRFVEEKRNRLVKVIQDKDRWSSICAFWLKVNPKSKRSMTRERTDTMLRAVVKHFFIDKEVTSTLVMDSLYSGLRALEGQFKSKNGRCNPLGTEESPFPVVFLDEDMFAFSDDVLLLVERASLEPLPSKEDKGLQSHMKDGGPRDKISQESVEQDERRLTELGRRVIEIFFLAHIFGKIECAYQEVVKLEREEELISEEGKQKRNNHKGGDHKTIASTLNKLQVGSLNESKGSL